MYLRYMLSHLAILFAMQLRSFMGAVLGEWKSNRLKLISGVITMCVMGVGFYYMFHGLFGYLSSLDADMYGFGTALASRLFGMALLAFGVFVGISSLITGNTSLYRASRIPLLLSSAVNQPALAVSAVLESWFNAGWTMLLMGVPMLLAFARGLEFTKINLAAGFLLYPFLLVVWSAAGTVVTVLLSRFGGLNGWKLFGGIAVIAGCGAVFFFASGSSTDLVIQESSGMSLDKLQSFVSGLPGQNSGYWPHVLFLKAMTQGELIPAVTLIGEALVLAFLALWSATAGYLKVWNTSRAVSAKYQSSQFFRDGGRYSTVFQKDLLLFFRDPVQWSQLGLLTGMFSIYVINLNRFAIDFSNPYWLAVGIFINISFSAFVVATMMVRFAFPAPSMESPGLHALIQLPHGRKLFYRSKWIQTLLFSAIPASVLAWVSTRSIGAGVFLQIESVVCIFITAVVLSTMNISLGCIFLKRDTASAVSISSGQGGIIAAFASVAFVLFIVTVLSWVTRRYMSDNFTEMMLAVPVRNSILYLMLPVGVVTSALAYRAGMKNLESRVF
ncbi:MAG: hypothetical protein J7K88_02040 [Candidatus Fermentibacteraceae bacterium]|nr:hypothetical protein [Candidatus Fermentibacteraceae bacterium]